MLPVLDAQQTAVFLAVTVIIATSNRDPERKAVDCTRSAIYCRSRPTTTLLARLYLCPIVLLVSGTVRNSHPLVNENAFVSFHGIVSRAAEFDGKNLPIINSGQKKQKKYKKKKASELL